MNIDWVHMLVTMLIIGIVFLGLERSEAYRRSSRARRTGMLVGFLFPLLLLLNTLWPAA
jgi:uncharacterized membrane protein YecN with MAPEG domain